MSAEERFAFSEDRRHQVPELILKRFSRLGRFVERLGESERRVLGVGNFVGEISDHADGCLRCGVEVVSHGEACRRHHLLDLQELVGGTHACGVKLLQHPLGVVTGILQHEERCPVVEQRLVLSFGVLGHPVEGDGKVACDIYDIREVPVKVRKQMLLVFQGFDQQLAHATGALERVLTLHKDLGESLKVHAECIENRQHVVRQQLREHGRFTDDAVDLRHGVLGLVTDALDRTGEFSDAVGQVDRRVACFHELLGERGLKFGGSLSVVIATTQFISKDADRRDCHAERTGQNDDRSECSGDGLDRPR